MNIFQIRAQTVKLPVLIKYPGPLPCWQNPAATPCPELDIYQGYYVTIYISKINFNIIITSMLRPASGLSSHIFQLNVVCGS